MTLSKTQQSTTNYNTLQYKMKADSAPLKKECLGPTVCHTESRFTRLSLRTLK